MIYYLCAFGMLLHVFFWGAGLAVFAMAGPWKRFWPVLIFPAGFALQSLVVWLAAYSGLHGTNQYSWWAELIPAALAVVALRRKGSQLARDLARFGGVGAIVLASLAVLVRPLARAAGHLTTASLGSCDAADYAAGARTLMEFAHSDRTGFLGLTEVVRVMSADNFFDFWLRLNHFTPAALLALNGSIFRLAPHEITGVYTAVLLAGSVPVVFWMARALLYYRPTPSVWIAALYGMGPVTAYAVYHVAMGQLLAAPAIALLTWAGVALWRGRVTWRRGLGFGGVLSVGYAIVLGSYNFILLVALVPAVAFAGVNTLRRGHWGRFGRWLVLVLAPLVGCGLVYATRVAGLAERFSLFGQYDFGWHIPMLGPEGWLGVLRDTTLAPLGAGVRLVLGGVILAALAVAFVVAGRRRPQTALLAACLAGPALVGYIYLNWRGATHGTNASYDAYKLFAVYYPGSLAAFCLWVGPTATRVRWGRGLGVVLALVVSVGTAQSIYQFQKRMAAPPLIVTPELAGVQAIERHPEVNSVNMLIPDMWSRLWANEFILRKPQFFLTHTYEGRKNTPLRGDWDLTGGLVDVTLPGSASVALPPGFSVLNTRSPYFIRAALGRGWYDLERLPRGSTQWRWTQGEATLDIDNPHPRAVRLVCRFQARSLVDRDLEIWMDGQRLRTVMLGQKLAVVRVPEFSIPAGHTVLELRSSTPPTQASSGDLRPLGFAAYHIEIEVLADDAAAAG